MIFKTNDIFYVIMSNFECFYFNLKECFNLYHWFDKRNECILKKRAYDERTLKLFNKPCQYLMHTLLCFFKYCK